MLVRRFPRRLAIRARSGGQSTRQSPGLHACQGDSVAAVEQFVPTIDRQRVPHDRLAETLADITRRYLELVSHMASVPVTTDRVQALVEQAEVARKTWEFERDGRLLEQTSAQSLRDPRRARARAAEMVNQAASVKALRAGLALVRLDRALAAQWRVEAFDLKSDAPDSTASWWLFDPADAHVWRGDSASA